MLVKGLCDRLVAHELKRVQNARLTQQWLQPYVDDLDTAVIVRELCQAFPSSVRVELTVGSVWISIQSARFHFTLSKEGWRANAWHLEDMPIPNFYREYSDDDILEFVNHVVAFDPERLKRALNGHDLILSILLRRLPYVCGVNVMDHVEISRGTYFREFHCEPESLLYKFLEDHNDKLQAQIAIDLSLKGLDALVSQGVEVRHTFGNKSPVEAATEAVEQTIGKESEYFWDIVQIITNLTIMFRVRHDLPTLTLAFVNMMMSFRISVELVYQVWERIKDSFLNLLTLFTNQAQAAFETVITSVVTVIVTILTVIGTFKLPAQSMVTNILRRVNDIGRAIQGSKTLFSAIGDLIRTTVRMVATELFGVAPGGEELEEYLVGIKNFFTDVQEVLKKESQDLISTDYAYCDRVETLYNQGMRFTQTISTLELSPVQKAPFDYHFRALTSLYNRVVTLGVRKTTPRPEPITIQFFGTSEIGKSNLVYLVAQDILSEEDQRINDWYQEIYFRSVSQDFWDGYTGQLITVYDDFGQLRDTTGKPNMEFIEIIKNNNIAPHPLHMADLHEKRATFFRSRALILTSNKQRYNMESLTEPSALLRRREVVVEVQPRADLRGKHGGFDQNLVDKAIAAGKLSSILTVDAYDFCWYNRDIAETDPKTGQKTWIGYDEMIDRLLKIYKRRIRCAKERIEILKDRFVTLCEKKKPKAQIALAKDELAKIWGGMMFDDCNNPLLLTLDLDPDQKKNCVSFVTDKEPMLLFNYLMEFPLADVPVSCEQAVDYMNIFDTVLHEPRRSLDIYKIQAQKFLTTFKTRFLDFWQKPSSALMARACALILAGVAVWSLGRVALQWCKGEETKPRVVLESSYKRNEVPRLNRVLESSAKRNDVMRKQRILEGDVTFPHDVVHLESVSDTNHAELISNKVLRNIYKLYRVTEESGEQHEKMLLNVLFIRGRLAICPAHVIPYLKGSLRLKSAFVKGLDFDAQELVVQEYPGEKKDLCMILFPKTFCASPDLFKHFLQRGELDKIDDVMASLLTLREKQNNMIFTQFSSMDTGAINDDEYEQVVDGRIISYKNRRGYTYRADTQFGDCGGPLAVYGSTFPRKLIGIHVAGMGPSNFRGLSVSVTQHDLNKMMSKFPPEHRISLDMELPTLRTECAKIPEGEFIPVGTIERSVRPPNTTDIFPSPVSGEFFEPITAPTAKAPGVYEGEKFDPLFKGMEKCGKTPPRLKPDVLSDCVDHYAEKLHRNVKYERKVLTYEEAVMGRHGDTCISPINRKSSPGYPWIMKRKGNGKHEWLGRDDYKLDDPELRNAFDTRLQRARQGERTPTFFVATLKDERVKLAKVKKGKTRVFAAAPMDYVLVYRALFGEFFAHITQNRIHNECAVGINPYGPEWAELAQYLQQRGEKVVAGDFSNYDGTLHNEVLAHIPRIANEWYDDGPENSLARYVLWEEITGSIQICEASAFMLTHSQPSGNPGTAPTNSIVNSIYARYAWKLIMKDTPFSSLMYFDRYVNLITYGDDNVYNISDEVVDMFNQETLTSAFARMGLTYTMEDKDCEVVPSRMLTEVTFLKRRFRFDREYRRWEAPLELDSVLEMCNWVRGREGHHTRCKENLEKALAELSLHGREVFDEWKPKIQKAGRSLTVPVDIYSYGDYKDMRLEEFF